MLAVIGTATAVMRLACTPAMGSPSRLDHLHGEPNPRRHLITLGLPARQLAPYGIEPILVGGGALEFYAAGG